MLIGHPSAVLYECPIGKVHRESPYAFDVINAHSMSEGEGLSLLMQSRWLQRCFRVVGSEQDRHRKMRESERQAKRDSKYGAAVLRGR